MADDTPVTLPSLAVGDVWGTLTNANIRTIESRINTLRQEVLDLPDPVPVTDGAIAALVDDVASATRASVALAGLQLVTAGGLAGSNSTASRSNHAHNATEIVVTPFGTLAATTVRAALQEILDQLETLAALVTAGAGVVPTGFVVVRRYISGAWPARGTLAPGTVVFWIGPGDVALPSDYVSGTDAIFGTAS